MYAGSQSLTYPPPYTVEPSWKRGGGSNLFLPQTWPKVGGTVVRTRNAPWSYIMNVCTHSYVHSAHVILFITLFLHMRVCVGVGEWCG
jgi:hypothetical protein